MRRYILTGAPGAGKTSIIRALEIQGYPVVEEAATDVISYKQSIGDATPWKDRDFPGQVASLQKQRQLQADWWEAEVVFYDRSPFCTYALALYLGLDIPGFLLEEIDRLQQNEIYQKRVFFVENLGSIANTDARQITFEEALKFERIHREVYDKFGYEYSLIRQAPIFKRVELILVAT